MSQFLGNGTAQITPVNGTRTVVINGTLPNGTLPNGTDDTSAGSVASGGAGPWTHALVEGSGWWSMVTVVLLTVWL